MENVPLNLTTGSNSATSTSEIFQLPTLSDLIHNAKTSTPVNRRASLRKNKNRAFSPLNISAAALSRTPSTSDNTNHSRRTSKPDASQASSNPSLKATAQLPTPPASQIFTSADVSPRATDMPRTQPPSTRKRSRQPSATVAPVVESPNPKARKQRRLSAESDDEDEDPPRRAGSRSLPPGGQFVPFPASTPIKPPEKVNNKAAPKSERPARVKKTPASSTTKSRRKSALGKKKGSTSLDLGSLEEEEHDTEGEDPLLLVEDEWQPISSKPKFHTVIINGVKKEEEDVDLSHPLQSSLNVVTNASRQSSSQVDSALERDISISESEVRTTEEVDTFLAPVDDEFEEPSRTTATTAVRPSSLDWDENSFLDCPEADSSFTGMELEPDEDETSFTVPLRTDSPPPRHRRSSAVSQRPPTPGNTSNSGQRVVRRESVPLESAGSPSNEPTTEGPLKFVPVTPSRTRLVMSVASPYPYPSPKLMGTKLGSLSPEKGRGPSRGVHPKLEEGRPVKGLFSQILGTTSEGGGAVGSSAAGGSYVRLARPGEPSSDDHVEEDVKPLLQPPSKTTARLDSETGLVLLLDSSDEEDDDAVMEIERALTEPLEDDVSANEEAPNTSVQSNQARGDDAQEDGSADEDLIQLASPEPPSQTVPSTITLLQGANGYIYAPANPDARNQAVIDMGGAPVTVFSPDPFAAAATASILKNYHFYREDGGPAHFNFLPETSGNFETPTRRLGTPVVNSPLPKDFLKQVDDAIASPEVNIPAHVRNFVPAGLETPIHPGPNIPVITFDPASVRKPVDGPRWEREAQRPWGNGEWKHLRKLMFQQQAALEKERGEEVDTSEVNIDAIVEDFFDAERLVGDDEDWEGDGDWSRQMVKDRVRALAIKYSKDHAASYARVGSPMLVPSLTPAPSRQPTPLDLGVGSSKNGGQPPRPLSRSASLRSISPMAAPLHGPQYNHLYSDAAAIAGFSTTLREPTPQSTDSPSPAPRPASTQPFSRIPRSRSTTTKTLGSSMPPPPAPVRRMTTPVQDTPSVAKRVLGVLGLNGRRTSKPKFAPVRSQVSKPMLPPPPPVEEPRVVRKRVPEPAPVAPAVIPLSVSQEDLNHVEPAPPRLATPPPHPKDLVELQPVSPKLESPVPLPKPRRSSGSSVKDLIQNFESLTDSQEKEKDRITRLIYQGRRSSSNSSLRRSNLSTASVISADDPDISI